MNGQMQSYNWDEYKKQISTIQQPISLKQFSNSTMDMRGLSEYAISKGKKIQDLSIEEQKKFIHN